MIRILVEETADRNGKFTATVYDRVLCTSRKPFLDAARVLLDEGTAPSTRIVMVRASGEESLRSTIGAAARLCLSEPDRGLPRFVPWKPFSPRTVWPPVRQNEEG